jgi:hypothetical protein
MEQNTVKKRKHGVAYYEILEVTFYKILSCQFPNLIITNNYWLNVDGYLKCYDVNIPSHNLLIEFNNVYWHAQDKINNFTSQQINNMANDMLKNRLALNAGKSIIRIKTSIENKQKLKNASTIKDLIDISYYAQIDGDIKKDGMFQFKTTKQSLITRSRLIRLNDETLQGPGKKYTETILKPVLITFFQEYVRTYGWWRHPTKDTIVSVISKLRERKVDLTHNDISSLTRIGNDYLKSIFTSYWNVNKGPAKLWFNTRRFGKVIDYRLGLNNSKDYTYILDDGTKWTGNETFDISPFNLVRGFVVQRASVSWFKPTVAYHIYTKYCDNILKPIVWDPSMGFGARMLAFVAACQNGKYIGTDPAKETFENLTQLKNEIHQANMFDGDIILHNMGSETLKLDNNVGDLVFTSPPYFDTEQYFDEPGQCWRDHNTLEVWVKNYLLPTFLTAHSFLKQNGIMVINISHKHKETIISTALNAGFILQEELRLMIGRDHFSKKNEKSINISKQKFEPILIFIKT